MQFITLSKFHITFPENCHTLSLVVDFVRVTGSHEGCWTSEQFEKENHIPALSLTFFCCLFSVASFRIPLRLVGTWAFY